MRRDMKNNSEVNIYALFTNRLSYGRSVQTAASIAPRTTVIPLSYHSMQCSVGGSYDLAWIKSRSVFLFGLVFTRL